MAGRVPEYFTRMPRAEGVRLATNAPFIPRRQIAGNVTSAALELAGAYLEQERREQRIADNRQYEESSIALNSSLSEKAEKFRFSREKFDAACQEEREKFLADVAEDKKADYGLLFDRTAARYSQNVFQNEQRLNREKQTAVFLDASKRYYDGATTAARSGNMDEAQYNINRFMEIRESLMNSGEISAEKYADMGLRFSDEVEKQKVLGEFDSIKPQGDEKVREYIGSFLEREDMPVERRQKFANAMMSDYRTFQANKALTGKQFLEQADFIADAVSRGLEPGIDTTAVLSGLEDSGNYEAAKKLRQVISLGAETKEFVKLDPAAMKAEIDDLKKNPQTPYDLARLNSFEKTMSAALTEIRNDPMNFAISRNIVDDQALDFSKLTPEAAQKRLQNAKLVQQYYHLPAAPVLTKSEAAVLTSAINAGDARSNAALLATISQSFPENTGDIVRSIAPKAPQFAQAAALYRNNPAAAVDIIEGVDMDGNEIVRHSSDEEPFSALVFKIMTDPFVGKLAYFRAYSGTVNSGSYVLNATKGKKERVGRILQMHANKRQELDKVYSGDIAAAIGFKFSTTGDTICDEQHPVILESMEFPEPVIELAIEPKTKASQGKLGESLAKLAEEDPTFRAHTDQETGQTIIAGMGELHLEIIVDRLLREFKVEANVGAPQVAYKEAFTKAVDVDSKYAKQSGGRGQYGHCKVKFEPMDVNGEETFKFESTVVGGAIPKEYIPAVGEGIEEAMQSGILGGFPVVGIHANVYDGSYHEVDSSEMAFHIAGSLAFKDAMKKAAPVLLEPIMKVEVTMPEEYMGDVIGDINSRRGRIEGMDDLGGGKIVRGYVPLSEMFGYSTDLRSRTQGRGNYSMFFEKYEPVPKSVQEKVLSGKNE